MTRTSIEWTRTYNADGTFTKGFSSNPIVAINRETGRRGWFCTKVSTGCAHCYSERVNHRFGNFLDYSQSNEEQIEMKLNEKELRALERMKKPAKVFLCDMTDLFHPMVPEWMIDQIVRTMAEAKRITFQVLTKRAARMQMYCESRWKQGALPPWAPLPNVWWGVSVEDQKSANHRIPLLLQTPAAVRFLSCEPLIGPLDLRPYLGFCFGCQTCQFQRDHLNSKPQIQWVIDGGESGANARPSHPQWFRDIRDQCAIAGVPYFHKQNGEWLAGWCNTMPVHQFPDNTFVTRIGKKQAGRLLDGREHNEMPQPQENL